MSIGARIQECVNKLSAGDAENAFIQLAIAIDGTAKRLYPNKGTTARCKAFLRERLPFVLWSLTNGAPNSVKSFEFELGGDGVTSEWTTYEELIYTLMRCPLLHEGELGSKVEFVDEPYIGTLRGRIQFPIALVGALLFAVIASPVNANESVSQGVAFRFGEKLVSVREMLGSEERTRAAIRNGFLYDVEALPERGTDEGGTRG